MASSTRNGRLEEKKGALLVGLHAEVINNIAQTQTRRPYIRSQASVNAYENKTEHIVHSGDIHDLARNGALL